MECALRRPTPSVDLLQDIVGLALSSYSCIPGASTRPTRTSDLIEEEVTIEEVGPIEVLETEFYTNRIAEERAMKNFHLTSQSAETHRWVLVCD